MRPALAVRQPTTAVQAPASAEVPYETLNSSKSRASIVPAATITAQVGSKNARITSPDRAGTGASQRRAERLAEMTAEHTIKSAPTVANRAIATMAASAM